MSKHKHPPLPREIGRIAVGASTQDLRDIAAPEIRSDRRHRDRRSGRDSERRLDRLHMGQDLEITPEGIELPPDLENSRALKR